VQPVIVVRAIVFTAGIGENAPLIRSRVCRDAAWLGIEIEEAANAEGRQRISTVASRLTGQTLYVGGGINIMA
jgi:acetate kinase